jgi:RHH-type proline utilization regulon transcriptional repressor/proline dehydrogenase/delta 1-pyrroline-5-carboxylate dehydrogenase
MTAAFADFADPAPQEATRAAITTAYREDERACVRRLLAGAKTPPTTAALAKRLVVALREKGPRGGVEGLIDEYDLSSREGVALMCLAEALLRIPDAATRDGLIRDKISGGDWRSHLGRGRPLFVNAATWGLMLTGRLVAPADEPGLGHALTRLIARGGEPVIRVGVDRAIRLMGEQFVTGRNIAEALANSRASEARGYRHSYDMLGEAALTAADATRYLADYAGAIEAIGAASGGRGLLDGPGISVKLSALHPRYVRSQRDRVMAELLPRLAGLAATARARNVGLNIDAEEADRLDLSLDLLEALCADPRLAGWDGVGFVVQAYQKRAPFVIDHLAALARRTGRRLMVRLVKGAYWDGEIKRAQIDGLADFPVFSRKLHTDVSYLACAKKMLAAGDAIFPQFATHNAQTVAAVHEMAGPDFRPGQYEFQCLHGMGEALYEEVVGADKLNRPCRIYAPVGTHETLLAYLVRRLLENGANASFVNRIHDPAVSIDDLIADPLATAAATDCSPHPGIARPSALFGARANSAGLDLSDEGELRRLAAELQASPAPPSRTGTLSREGRNPADHDDLVGGVTDASPEEIDAALAAAAASSWPRTPAAERAAHLRRAADALQARMPQLLGLLAREAGKTLADGVGEVREAIDFLRYYADGSEGFGPAHVPLGPVVCISPWNFPLAIFTGQVAAALAAGNPVLAKPAEEAPLIAAEAVRLLHEAGVPPHALHLVQGDGGAGDRLVADERVCGVLFTGSTEVARLINRRLAPRGPVPLIAETGGQNVMVVDSSALPEQAVADALGSAFDSAGQRCSALRILAVQEDVADRVLDMLLGAMAELRVGDPARLATDVGPVISADARDRIAAHVDEMRSQGFKVHAAPLPPECGRGTFCAPTVIEIARVADVGREVFGPVLHLLRWPRGGLDALMDEVEATGYRLTFGVHSRIDATVERAVARSRAGNVYVNRNIIGAVVGVQPFGGAGLSGTGPKAGGPMYLRRLLASHPDHAPPAAGELPGPVGERNVYDVLPRGAALCLGPDVAGQAAAARAAGCSVVTDADLAAGAFDVAFCGPDRAREVCVAVAARDGPIVPVHTRLLPEHLLRERSVSTNTAAAGGNATLMTLA